MEVFGQFLSGVHVGPVARSAAPLAQEGQGGEGADVVRRREKFSISKKECLPHFTAHLDDLQ